jgi:hypothetical protein
LYEKNRLAYFLPHGPVVKRMIQCHKTCAHMEWDHNDLEPRTGAGTAGACAINDTEHDIIELLKGTQTGGTAHGVIFSLLRIIECDPDWHCFKEHGLKYIPWTGPKEWLIMGYNWAKLADNIWPEYLKFLPSWETGKKHWDLLDRFISGKVRRTTLFKSKTVIHFGVYSQAHHRSLAGVKLDGGHPDEQIPEDMFDELVERTSTRRIPGIYKPQFIFTLTGHKVEEDADSGGGGWLKRKVYDGRDTKGLQAAVYHVPIPNTPHEIIDQETKAQKYERLVLAPRNNQDKEAERRGMARYWAQWEMAGSLHLDAWDPDIHWIEPFDIFKGPENRANPNSAWPQPVLLRAIDHGEGVSPTACLWIAVYPFGYVCYREYYVIGKGISHDVVQIVKMSGNERIFERELPKDIGGDTWAIWREHMTTEKYYYSILDSRTFAHKSPREGICIGEYYQDKGLDVEPAPGVHNYRDKELTDGAIPMVNDWFRPDYKKMHLTTHRPGAPRIYVFNTLIHLRDEIEGLTHGKPIHKQEDHLICDLKWCVTLDVQWFEPDRRRQDGDEYARVGNLPKAPYTGY